MNAWRSVCAVTTAGAVLLSTCGISSAGSPQQKTEAVVGSASANLAARGQKAEAAVDEVFEDLTAAGSPGCALGVYRDGQMIYAKGYGLANIEENVPITPKSVFDIGSTSKQFTASSILLLEKQGKLSVDDDIRKYLPEIPDYGKKITILNLLNHTSGLRDYLTLFDLAGVNIDSVTTDDDALALIVRQKALNFPPGSEYLYSNTGFFLLSLIVKRVSGETLRNFAAENIFTPLNMTHTQFRDSHTMLIAERAMAYDPKEKNDGFTMNVSYFEQTGDGAVHTSVEDLLKWDENFYSGQVGGKIFLAELQEKARLNNGKVLNYAKGLVISNYRGLPRVSHGGSWGGYRAELLRFPTQHFSVACLCNLGTADPSRRALEVADVYLNGQMKPKTVKKEEDFDDDAPKKEGARVSLTTEELRAYAGDYWGEEVGANYRLGVADGALKIVGVTDRSGMPRTNSFSPNELRPTGKDTFVLGGESLIVKFRRDGGAVAGFELDAGRSTGVTFTRTGAGGSGNKP